MGRQLLAKPGDPGPPPLLWKLLQIPHFHGGRGKGPHVPLCGGDRRCPVSPRPKNQRGAVLCSAARLGRVLLLRIDGSPPEIPQERRRTTGGDRRVLRLRQDPGVGRPPAPHPAHESSLFGPLRRLPRLSDAAVAREDPLVDAAPRRRPSRDLLHRRPRRLPHLPSIFLRHRLRPVHRLLPRRGGRLPPFPRPPPAAAAAAPPAVLPTPAPCPLLCDASPAPDKMPAVTEEDEDIISSVVAGKTPSYILESKLGDCRRAAGIRREALRRMTGRALEGLLLDGFDYGSILGQCCELPVGYVQLPVGIAGPLLLDGRQYYVPMATTEGCLVASTNRGCKAIAVSGGAASVVLRDGMTRAPAVRLPSAKRAAELMDFVEEPNNFETLSVMFNR